MDRLKPQFELPPVVRQQAPPADLVSSSEKTLTTQPSRDSCSDVDFARAMLVLTTLKRTAAFTAQELEGWHCVLKRFPAPILNEAVVELATSETRFPEVADLFRLCQRKMPRPYCPNRGDDDLGKPTASVVREIARDLGLDV